MTTPTPAPAATLPAWAYTCPRCRSTSTQEFGLPIPHTDDSADCVRCLACGLEWGIDPGADGACAECGGSGDVAGDRRNGECPCVGQEPGTPPAGD